MLSRRTLRWRLAPPLPSPLPPLPRPDMVAVVCVSEKATRIQELACESCDLLQNFPGLRWSPNLACELASAAFLLDETTAANHRPARGSSKQICPFRHRVFMFPHHLTAQAIPPQKILPTKFSTKDQRYSTALISHGPHEADSPQVHRRQGAPQAAGHQGSPQVRPCHGRRQEAPQVCLHVFHVKEAVCLSWPSSCVQPRGCLLLLASGTPLLKSAVVRHESCC